MSLKGLLSLFFGLTLVVFGIWLTIDQARHEQQWNLARDAANGVIPGELPGDAPGVEGTDSDDDRAETGIVKMLP